MAHLRGLMPMQLANSARFQAHVYASHRYKLHYEQVLSQLRRAKDLPVAMGIC